MKGLKSIIIAVLTLLAIALSTVVPSFAADLSKDGEYSVDVYLVQKEKDSETPASDGILKQAKIVVKNGKATMFINTQPVTVALQTSTLKGMTVFKTADASDSGAEAKIVSKDKNGDPNCFSFELPHTKEFIRIRVDTGLKIPGKIGARLKVDWASLRLVKADITTTQATTKKTEPSKTEKEDASTTAKAEETTKVTETTTVKTETSTTEPTVAEVEPTSEEDAAILSTTFGAESDVTTAAPKKSPVKIIVPAVIAAAAIAVVIVIVVKKKKG